VMRQIIPGTRCRGPIFVRFLDSPFFHEGLYQIAFVQNDAGEMARQVAWSQSNPGGGRYVAHAESRKSNLPVGFSKLA
jgi:hypothetical protein